MSIVDIIIPVYNNEKTIYQCLESIFEQTFQDFNVILVNDGSTDNTLKVINHFVNSLTDNQKNKVRIINQENKGSNGARNKGAKASRAEFILFCDADVKLKKNYLSLTKEKLLKNPDKSYCYTSFKYGWKTFKLWPFDAAKLKQMPYIHTTSLIRRQHFPGFDENIKRLQDWDLWLTMLEQGHSGIWLPEVLFEINARSGKISNWLPKFAYKMPFLKKVKNYNETVGIIKRKHNLP